LSNKITFIIGSLSGGGSEGVCVNLANGLATRGWQVDLVCMNLNRKKHIEKISKKVNLVNLGIGRFIFSFIPIMCYLKKNSIRHVFCFHYFFALQLIIQNFLLNNQFKIIARNNTSPLLDLQNYFSINIFNKLIFKMTKFLYHKVDYLIAQCEDMKLDLIENFSFEKEKVRIIFNPISLEIEQSYKNEKFLKENFILVVGRLSKEKRHDIAIEVFAKVKQKFPQLKLKIAGEGQEEIFLRDVAKMCGVENSVEFLGYQKNLVPLYKKARLTLMTSSHEGFPNALIESLTLGTPIVSIDCPTGPREIIQDGINGFLVNDDKDMLEQKIIETLNQEWNIEIINKTVSNHKNEKIINDYDDFFNNLLISTKKIY